MKISTSRNNAQIRKRYTALSAVILILIWAALAALVDMELKLPSPWRIAQEVYVVLGSRWFFQAVASTLFRIFKVFVISMMAGAAAGFAGAFFPVMDDLLRPLILLIRSTPTVVVILLAFIWIGQEHSPVLVGFMVVFPIVYTNVINGLRNVDGKLVQMGQLYGLGTGKMIRHIYLPSIEPYFRAAMSSAIGLNMKVMIAAEVICQPRFGLGTQLQQERMIANTPGLIALGIISILLVGLIEKLVDRIRPQKV